MKTKPILLSLLACAMFAGIGMNPAVAQGTNTPGIDRTQDEISARIQQGISAGRITRQEADVLSQRERSIRMRENAIKSDGNADPRERGQLRNDLETLRADVENMINNPPRAANNTPGIDRAQEEIGARIQQGVASGHITRREADVLSQRARNIQIHESRIKSDGVASPREREQLRNDLAGLRADVERMINNPRTTTSTPAVDDGEYQVRARIEQGLQAGDLTRRQAMRFNSRARDIERHEANYKADGIVTRAERRSLRNEVQLLRDDVERAIN
jgi:hypothetical protein